MKKCFNAHFKQKQKYTKLCFMHFSPEIPKICNYCLEIYKICSYMHSSKKWLKYAFAYARMQMHNYPKPSHNQFLFVHFRSAAKQELQWNS